MAMFIAEAIPSCGGQMMLPPGYLAQVYAVMQAAGVVCVADEVQTGFGRVGDAFWAYQLHGVSPDVVTLGKPIGEWPQTKSAQPPLYVPRGDALSPIVAAIACWAMPGACVCVQRVGYWV